MSGAVYLLAVLSGLMNPMRSGLAGQWRRLSIGPLPLDQFGRTGFKQYAATLGRIAGPALMIVGVVMVSSL